VKRARKTQGRNERGERDKRNNGNNTKSVEKQTLQIVEKEEVTNERMNNPMLEMLLDKIFLIIW